MKKEEVTKKIVEYFSKNYSNKADMAKLPLDGGLMHYLGIDSLSSLEILIDMESLFGIEITDELLSFKLVDNIEFMAETFANITNKQNASCNLK